MNIRPAKMSDLDEISAVESACFPPIEAASKESLEKRINAYGDSFLVAEEDGRIIGFINGSATDERVIHDEMFSDIACHKENGTYQAIFGLSVAPEHQRKGIARTLMNALIDHARSHGKKGLILTCKEHLVAYYGTFGYQNLGVSASTHGGAVWYDMILEFNK